MGRTIGEHARSLTDMVPHVEEPIQRRSDHAKGTAVTLRRLKRTAVRDEAGCNLYSALAK